MNNNWLIVPEFRRDQYFAWIDARTRPDSRFWNIGRLMGMMRMRLGIRAELDERNQ